MTGGAAHFSPLPYQPRNCGGTGGRTDGAAGRRRQGCLEATGGPGVFRLPITRGAAATGGCSELGVEVAGPRRRWWAGGQGGMVLGHGKLRRLQNVSVTTIELCVNNMTVE